MSKILNKDPLQYKREFELFLSDLKCFHVNKGTPFNRLPLIGGYAIDLYLLYVLVTTRGGCEKVNSANEWQALGKFFHIPDACSNASLVLKHLYLRYLEHYEKVNFHGEDLSGNHDDETIVHDRTSSRASKRSSARLHSSIPASYNYSQHNLHDSTRRTLGMGTRRALSEYDSLVLSLLSPLPNEQDFAINVCTLMSCEPMSPALFDRHPPLMSALFSHTGLFTHKRIHLYMLEQHNNSREFDLLHFWRKRLHPTQTKHFTDLIQSCDVTPASDCDSLFAGADLAEESAERHLLHHMIQIFEILCNLSADTANCVHMARDTACLRVLLLAAHTGTACPMLATRARDTLVNIAAHIDAPALTASLQSSSSTTTTTTTAAGVCAVSGSQRPVVPSGVDHVYVRRTVDCLVATCADWLHSEDRADVLTALDICTQLCARTRADTSSTSCDTDCTAPLTVHTVHTRLVTDVFVSRVLTLLTLPDVMLLVVCLEWLLTVSQLGEWSCCLIADTLGATKSLVSLMTFQTKSYGPSAYISMRVLNVSCTDAEQDTDMSPLVTQQSDTASAPCHHSISTVSHSTSTSCASISLPLSVYPPPSTTLVSVAHCTGASCVTSVSLCHTPAVHARAVCVAVSPATPAYTVSYAAASRAIRPSTATCQVSSAPYAASVQSVITSQPAPVPSIASGLTSRQVPMPNIQSQPLPASIRRLVNRGGDLSSISPVLNSNLLNNENSIWVMKWLQTVCEISASCNVEQTALYKQYTASAVVQHWKGIVTQAEFAGCVKSVFGSNVNAVGRKNTSGVMEYFFDGIRSRLQIVTTVLPTGAPTTCPSSSIPHQPFPPGRPRNSSRRSHASVCFASTRRTQCVPPASPLTTTPCTRLPSVVDPVVCAYSTAHTATITPPTTVSSSILKAQLSAPARAALCAVSLGDPLASSSAHLATSQSPRFVSSVGTRTNYLHTSTHGPSAVSTNLTTGRPASIQLPTISPTEVVRNIQSRQYLNGNSMVSSKEEAPPMQNGLGCSRSPSPSLHTQSDSLLSDLLDKRPPPCNGRLSPRQLKRRADSADACSNGTSGTTDLLASALDMAGLMDDLGAMQSEVPEHDMALSNKSAVTAAVVQSAPTITPCVASSVKRLCSDTDPVRTTSVTSLAHTVRLCAPSIVTSQCVGAGSGPTVLLLNTHSRVHQTHQQLVIPSGQLVMTSNGHLVLGHPAVSGASQTVLLAQTPNSSTRTLIFLPQRLSGVVGATSTAEAGAASTQPPSVVLSHHTTSQQSLTAGTVSSQLIVPYRSTVTSLATSVTLPQSAATVHTSHTSSAAAASLPCNMATIIPRILKVADTARASISQAPACTVVSHSGAVVTTVTSAICAQTRPLPDGLLCEWDGCLKGFSSATQVYRHAVSEHCPATVLELPCLWFGCDRMVRKRYSMITHLQDKHCTHNVLKLMRQRREQIYRTGSSHIPAPLNPAPHPGYANNAALQAIRRHAVSASLLPDDTRCAESDTCDPVSQSVRLTAALVLRNLVTRSSRARHQVIVYEQLLVRAASGTGETSRVACQILGALATAQNLGPS